MKVVLVSGGFDPLHSGHIAYFNEAKKLGDILVVGVNSNEWLTRKKGQPFMDINERVEIVKNLSKSFNFVRVDLYNKDGHIYFGELTFSPGSGYEPFSDYKYDAYYGKLLNK